MLRQTWPDLIHLARPGVVREGVGEPFASHIGDLEAVADALVTWQPSVADLPQAVDRALKELAVRA
jgi:hypothetical protein